MQNFTSTFKVSEKKGQKAKKRERRLHLLQSCWYLQSQEKAHTLVSCTAGGALSEHASLRPLYMAALYPQEIRVSGGLLQAVRARCAREDTRVPLGLGGSGLKVSAEPPCSTTRPLVSLCCPAPRPPPASRMSEGDRGPTPGCGGEERGRRSEGRWGGEA